MKFRRRSAVLLLGCAALMASQVYACGIELETSPGDADDGGSSGTPKPSSSGVGPSSSGGSSGVGPSSSGGSGTSGEPIDDGGNDVDAPDAPNCTTTVVPVHCPLLQSDPPKTSTEGGVTSTCVRTHSGDDNTLTVDGGADTGVVWSAFALGAETTWEVTAIVQETSASDLGAGFGIALVRRTADAASDVPGIAADSGLGLGIGPLTDATGFALAASTYNSQLVTSSVPTMAFPAGSVITGIANGLSYRIVLHHDAGAAQATGSIYVDGAPDPLSTEVAVSLPDGGSELVGAFAGNGNTYRATHALLGFSVTTCP